MRQPSPRADWPIAWKSSYGFDLEEVFEPLKKSGYAYAYAVRKRKTVELLISALSPPARVLDIAAAQGNFTLFLAERGYQVTWNDLRGDLQGYVELKHETGDVTYAPGNAFDLSFPSLFDGVLITEVIEHVAHPDAFLQAAAKLVRPGGYLVMTTPNGGYLRNRLPRFSDCKDPSVYESMQFKPDSDGHIFLLYSDEIRRFATEAGLVIEKLQFFTNPLTNGHMKTSHLLRILPRFIVELIETGSQALPSCLAERIHIQAGVLFRKSYGL
jgi:2-polyprenyl-6-hydroxyphenyl methylase/3-demethylubiquinone-9 3-methyltransferase